MVISEIQITFWESSMKWTRVIPGNKEPGLSTGPVSHWDSWDADVGVRGIGNVLLPLHHSGKCGSPGAGQSPLLPLALNPSRQPSSEDTEQCGLQVSSLNQYALDAKFKCHLPWCGIHQALFPHFLWQEVRSMYHLLCWPPPRTTLQYTIYSAQ